MSFYLYLSSFVLGLLSMILAYPPALGFGIACSLCAIALEK